MYITVSLNDRALERTSQKHKLKSHYQSVSLCSLQENSHYRGDITNLIGVHEQLKVMWHINLY